MTHTPVSMLPISSWNIHIWMNTFLHSSDCYYFLKVALCEDPGIEAICGSTGFPTCTTQCSNHFPITNSSLALWCRFVWLKMWKIVAKKKTNNITLIKDSHLLSQLKVTYPVLNLRGAVGKLLKALIPRPFGSTLSSGHTRLFDQPTFLLLDRILRHSWSIYFTSFSDQIVPCLWNPQPT